MTQAKEQTTQMGRREIISCGFITILTGLAYAEMISTVQSSIRTNGITFGTLVLFVVFFLTALRMFIGNQLHLKDISVDKVPGKMWLFDFSAIVIETTILIFMAGVCSIELSIKSEIGFIELLLMLYITDIIWICSRWTVGKFVSSWQAKIPWKWAGQNAVLVLAILIPGIMEENYYSFSLLIWLLIVNTAAFIFSVISVDYYNLLD